MLKAPCEHLWADGQSERENVILITDAQEKQMPETFFGTDWNVEKHDF